MIPASIPSPSTGVVHLGPFPLRAYALCIILGVLVAVQIGQRRATVMGYRAGTVADMAVVAVPAGIVGARIYHLVTSPEAYFDRGGDPVRALEIWKGGLGIWGGVLFGVAAGAWWCRRHGVDWLRLADACAPGIAVAQAIGRIGNYFNQELFGRPTGLPWGLEIDPGRDGTVPGARTYQPTFLYELLWDLCVAGLVVLAGRRFRLRRGQSLALYIALYTVGRGLVESLRSDAATHIAGLRINDWVSIIVCLCAIAAFVLLGRSTRQGRPTVEPGSASDTAATPAPGDDAHESAAAVRAGSGTGGVPAGGAESTGPAGVG